MNIETLTVGNGGEIDNGKLSRKGSNASTGSIIDSEHSKKLLQRNNSEVKIEAIFKELFSPDAVIVDTCAPDILTCLTQPEETEKDLRNHGKFVVKRETSLLKSPRKEGKPKMSRSPTPTKPRAQTIPKNVDEKNLHLRKNPIPLRKKK